MSCSLPPRLAELEAHDKRRRWREAGVAIVGIASSDLHKTQGTVERQGRRVGFVDLQEQGLDPVAVEPAPGFLHQAPAEAAAAAGRVDRERQNLRLAGRRTDENEADQPARAQKADTA